MKRKKKEHEAARTEDGTENDAPDDEVAGGGRACRQKGWWKRGDVEAKLNTVNMIAWVHKECDVIEEEALTKLQEAWDSSEQKDECIVRLNDLELLGTTLMMTSDLAVDPPPVSVDDDHPFIVLTETKF